MKLQQLRCLDEVVRNGFNVSVASRQLHASQSAVSKQLRQLERELGVPLFVRSGRTLIGLTATGQLALAHAERLLQHVQQMRQFARGSRLARETTLSIGTTHTQACYFLPDIIERFRLAHPLIQIELHVGTREQISEMIAARRIELAIASGAISPAKRWLMLPVYRWVRCAIVAPGHALAATPRLSLAALAQHRLISYSFEPTASSSLLGAFRAEGLDPDIVLTARDADVIKTYVRLGLGVGIIAETALDPSRDADLVALDASHLLPQHYTWVAFSPDSMLKRHVLDFVVALAPHIDAAALASPQQRRQRDIGTPFADAVVPLRRYPLLRHTAPPISATSGCDESAPIF
jgi:LysR family transcriptional regulator, cys regulon transcriptional activator